MLPRLPQDQPPTAAILRPPQRPVTVPWSPAPRGETPPSQVGRSSELTSPNCIALEVTPADHRKLPISRQTIARFDQSPSARATITRSIPRSPGNPQR